MPLPFWEWLFSYLKQALINSNNPYENSRPKKEFAEYYATNEWNNFKAVPIDLYEFIDNWLVGMKKDIIKPSIFPINEDSVIVEIDVLLRDITSELEKY